MIGLFIVMVVGLVGLNFNQTNQHVTAPPEETPDAYIIDNFLTFQNLCCP